MKTVLKNISVPEPILERLRARASKRQPLSGVIEELLDLAEKIGRPAPDASVADKTT